MKWSHGFILGTDVGQRPQMLNIILYLGQLSLSSQWSHMKWSHVFILGTEVGQRPQMLNIISYLGSSLFELLVWPHEVEPWFHSWYRDRVEILDAKYNLGRNSSINWGITIRFCSMLLIHNFIILPPTILILFSNESSQQELSKLNGGKPVF